MGIRGIKKGYPEFGNSPSGLFFVCLQDPFLCMGRKKLGSLIDHGLVWISENAY